MDATTLRAELAEHREMWKLALGGVVWIQILQLTALALIAWRVW